MLIKEGKTVVAQFDAGNTVRGFFTKGYFSNASLETFLFTFIYLYVYTFKL